MKYLRLSTLKKENPDLQFPVSEDQRIFFLESCRKAFPDASEKEQLHFFENCSDQKKLVFLSWTEENRSLIQLLEKRNFAELFTDSSRIQEHALFREFKVFIEPFLYQVFTESLNRISKENIHFLMSYAVLLPDYRQNLVQDSLSEWIFEQQKLLEQSLKKARKDTDLHRQIDAFLTPNLIVALNLLNINHYRVKTQLLEFFMSLTYHPKSSTRFLMYLSNKLLGINYTAEHKKQLSEFGTDVKKGKIVVESTRVSWLRLSVIILILVLCTGGIVALFFVEADPEEDIVQEQTAYMALSKEERQKLDSIITGVKSEERMVNDAQLDSNIPFVGTDLTKKRSWKNELFQKLYQHWGDNDSVAFTKFFTKEEKSAKPYINTKNLSKKGGQIVVDFQNETDLMVLIIVFKNGEKEPVYTKYINPKTLGEWKMNNGEHLIVLPGSKVPPNPKFGNLPFKEVDQHFYENLGIAYSVNSFKGKQIKLVWENLGNNESYLVDLSGALVKE